MSARSHSLPSLSAHAVRGKRLSQGLGMLSPGYVPEQPLARIRSCGPPNQDAPNPDDEPGG